MTLLEEKSLIGITLLNLYVIFVNITNLFKYYKIFIPDQINYCRLLSLNENFLTGVPHRLIRRVKSNHRIRGGVQYLLGSRGGHMCPPVAPKVQKSYFRIIHLSDFQDVR